MLYIWGISVLKRMELSILVHEQPYQVTDNNYILFVFYRHTKIIFLKWR